ncbi:MAG TPA: DUF531 domain-containing protein [Euryarchaeota archaeon]|nr:DUF531 domain-containing protein [Euryarchaeota archaeon]
MTRNVRGRLTIGLLNTYDRRSLREPHRRVIARCGPLCEAFDWNLALFGFPFPRDLRTPDEVANWLASTTSIGEDGRYTIELSDSGRLSIFPLPGRGFPPQLGSPVVTTRRPFQDCSVTVEEIAGRSLAGTSFLLLFGLGPKGIPSEFFEMSKIHFDVTARGKTLETCTAVGAVVASVSTAIRMLSSEKARD